jgi:hypothetical protein
MIKKQKKKLKGRALIKEPLVYLNKNKGYESKYNQEKGDNPTVKKFRIPFQEKRWVFKLGLKSKSSVSSFRFIFV